MTKGKMKRKGNQVRKLAGKSETGEIEENRMNQRQLERRNQLQEKVNSEIYIWTIYNSIWGGFKQMANVH